MNTIYLRSDAVATIYFAACFVWLLFEGGVYFFGKLRDSWIRYVRVRWWRLLDTVSSTRSLSVLLSAVGMTHTTQTVLVLVWWPLSEIIHMCARAAFTSRSYYSSRVFISFKNFGLCGYYSRAATIWGRQLFEGGNYLRAATIWGRRLLEEIRYGQPSDSILCISWQSPSPGHPSTVVGDFT